MIYSDSRYIDGTIIDAYRAYTDTYQKGVYRTWPSYTVTYYWYSVTAIDRIENIAGKVLGNPELWWRIMDANPDILNPFEIPAGTQLRIPSD